MAWASLASGWHGDYEWDSRPSAALVCIGVVLACRIGVAVALWPPYLTHPGLCLTPLSPTPLSLKTSILGDDIISTFTWLGLLRYVSGQYIICASREMLEVSHTGSCLPH